MKLLSHMIQLHPFRLVNGNPEFLILRRAADEPIYPNLWQVVTGMVEEGETAFQAAQREVREETGLEPENIYVLPYVTSFFNSKTDCVNFVPVFAAEVSLGDKVALSPEHQDLRWVDADGADEILPLPSHREGTKVLVDCIHRHTLELFGR